MITTPATKYKTCYNCYHLLQVITREQCGDDIESNIIECHFYQDGDRYESLSPQCDHYTNVFRKLLDVEDHLAKITTPTSN